MPSCDYSREEEIADTSMKRPHLVILGAGASRAAFPRGDAKGRLLPLMDDLVNVLGLESLFRDAGIVTGGKNFEVLYDQLSSNDEFANITQKLELRVADYFSHLSLPEHPCLYDLLVLSLRGKDVVATFNWDPFLYLALKRSYKVVKLPRWLYLHGCALLGTCEEHSAQGELSQKCPVCGSPFKPTRLLFPVTKKNYTDDPYISNQWTNLELTLKDAYAVTIFGYGAPQTDAAAISLMQNAWHSKGTRFFEEVEIIDICDHNTLYQRWQPLIYNDHFNVVTQFADCFVANHPRRTCEAYWKGHIEARFWEGNPIPLFSSLDEMWTWFSELAGHE